MIQQLIHMSILHTLRHNPSRENHSSPYHSYDHHRICQKITICYVSYCMTYAVWVIYYGKIGQCRGHLWLLYEVQSDANESPISSNILESFYRQGWFNWLQMTSSVQGQPKTYVTLLICAWLFGAIINWNQIVVIVIQCIFLKIFYQGFWITFLYLTT